MTYAERMAEKLDIPGDEDEWTDEEWEEHRKQWQQKLDYEEKIHNRRMAVMSGILLVLFGVALVSLFR